MKNRHSTLFVIGIIALGLSFFCARKLQIAKVDINPVIPKHLINPYCFGLNKFLSNISWMISLQDRGAIDKLNTDLANIIYRRANRLTSLDPLFFDAYSQCALEIGYVSPDQAMRLLDKAMNTGMCKSYDIPFRAGWIASYWKNDPTEAIAYYEKARELAGAPPHLDRLILHQNGKLAKNDPERVLELWCSYVSESNTDFKSEMSMHHLEAHDRQLALKKINDLANKILDEAAREFKKTKSEESRQTIVRVKQLVSDTVAAADRTVDTGAVNTLVEVTGDRTILMTPRSGRKSFTFQNVGKKPVYLKLGYGVSKDSYGYILLPNGGSYSGQGYTDVATAICPDGKAEVAVIEIY